MPTNAEIFAGPNRALDHDLILQVAKTNRNVDIVRKYNANKPAGEPEICAQTVGARISRSIDWLADKEGRDREEVKLEFEADRRKNNVAGRNQHIGKRKLDAEDDDQVEASTPAPKKRKPTPPRKKASSKRASGRGAQGHDAAVAESVTASPLLDKVGRRAASAPPTISTSMKVQERGVEGIGDDARFPVSGQYEEDHGKENTGAASTSGSSGSSSAADGNNSASPRGQGDSVGDNGDNGPGNTTSSELGDRSSTPSTPSDLQAPNPSSSSDEDNTSTPPASPADFIQALDDAEADTMLNDVSITQDDIAWHLAVTRTVPEIAVSANRAAGGPVHNIRSVDERLKLTVARFAERRGQRVGTVNAVLGLRRKENGIEADGMRRTE